MDARLIPLQADRDLIFDPFSRSICNRPIVASDGYIYELAEFLKFVEKGHYLSPHTRVPITHICPILHLERSLEETFKNHPERYDPLHYQDKEVALCIGEINDKLAQNKVKAEEIVKCESRRSIGISLFYSLLLFSNAYIANVLYSEDTDPTQELWAAGSFMVIDSTIRLLTQHEYNFFSLFAEKTRACFTFFTTQTPLLLFQPSEELRVRDLTQPIEEADENQRYGR